VIPIPSSRQAGRISSSIPREINEYSIWRSQIGLVASGVLWLAGGLLEGEARYAVWVLALAVDYSGPVARYWTPEQRAGLRRCYPQAEVHTFRGAGHTPWMSHREEYLSAIKEFLDQ